MPRKENPAKQAKQRILFFGAKVITLAFVMALVPAVASAQQLHGADSDQARLSQVSAGSSSGVTEGDNLSVSSDNSQATFDKSPFALAEFSRAQVGSNAPIAGVYEGYHYLASKQAGSVAVVVTDVYVVVYVPEQVAKSWNMEVSSAQSREQLKALLIELDARNAKGNTVIVDNVPWVFTSDQRFIKDDVLFEFDKELKPEEFSVCIIGTDGSDITAAHAGDRVKLLHADFATVKDKNDVELAQAPTGIQALFEFLSHVDLSPLWVTLKTTLTAIVFIFVLGIAAAYFSLRLHSRVQDIADSLFTIPLVLPPTVCGFLLLLAFGKNSAVGRFFDTVGFPLIFSWQATVLAAVVVAFPLMYRSARGAFENLDQDMLDAARTLGWSNGKILFKLMMPLSWSSIAAGTVLSFARALGEFGATLFVAGNYVGITRTIPIAIYFEWMNGNTDVALFWTFVIMLFSFVVILLINLWGRRTMKYRVKKHSGVFTMKQKKRAHRES